MSRWLRTLRRPHYSLNLPANAQRQADPAIDRIRSKLTDPSLRSDADPADLAALEAFYGSSSATPLWITDMGLSAKGQRALFEIEKANDWGLDATAFELPPAGDLPAGPDEQATTEIKLDLAILKYARFARGGRLNPRELSALFDQAPPLRDPKIVLMEIAAARSARYLSAVPASQARAVRRLREALLKMREAKRQAIPQTSGGSSSTWSAGGGCLRTLVLSMCGATRRSSCFMLSKTGKPSLRTKPKSALLNDPTPVFSADITTIVFNPEWIAPSSVLVKSLLPRLRKKNYSILEKYAFSVSYQGNPVNPDQDRLDPRQYPRLHLHPEAGTKEQSREGEIPFAQSS